MKKASLIDILTTLNETIVKLNETLVTNTENELTKSYRNIFSYYLTTFPEKKDDYIAILNMYNGSYRRAVIAIECDRIKQEDTVENNKF